jgi:hypothetical protein
MPPSDTLRRQVSFTSLGLAKGTFPQQSKVSPPTINGAAYCGEVPSLDDIVKDIVTPLLNYERLSHVMDVKKGIFLPATIPYDPADLVRQIDVEATTPQDLHNIILSHAQDTLHEGRNGLPWWEVLVLNNCNTKSPGQQSALVLRIHHALGDGLSLLHVFREILTTVDGTAPWPLDNVSARRNRPKYSWWSFLSALGKVLSLPLSRYDTNTAFNPTNDAKMVHSGRRQICVLPNVSLDFCKALKNKAQASVNDVLLAALSQAIYDYCRTKENDNTATVEASNNRDKMDPVTPKTQCRVLMPVGLPSIDPVHNPLTNRWCMVSCDLSVGQSDVKTRLDAIVQNTKRIKENPVAGVQLAVQNRVMRWLPLSIGRKTCLDVFSRHSLVITNVPGPSKSCQLAGQTVNDIQVIFNNLLTQINIVSYAGTIYGNVIYDPETLPGLSDVFGQFYANAFVDLAKNLGVPVPKNFVVD